MSCPGVRIVVVTVAPLTCTVRGSSTATWSATSDTRPPRNRVTRRLSTNRPMSLWCLTAAWMAPSFQGTPVWARCYTASVERRNHRSHADGVLRPVSVWVRSPPFGCNDALPPNDGTFGASSRRMGSEHPLVGSHARWPFGVLVPDAVRPDDHRGARDRAVDDAVDARR